MSNASSKSREFFEFTEDRLQKSSDGGKTWTKNQGQKVGIGAQHTVSEGHPISKKTGYRSGGGPFYSVRTKRNFPLKHISFKSGQDRLEADIGTPIASTLLSTAYQQMLKDPKNIRSEDTSDLDPLGATAISIVAPTNPNANLGTSLAELHREGLPSLPGVQFWKKRCEIAKAAASEFLNAEFAWLPLVEDVKDVAQSVQAGSKLLRQYERDEGRNVRREFHYPIERSKDSFRTKIAPSVVSTGSTGWTNPFGATLGSVDSVVEIEESRRKWFSGCFTYSIPRQSDSWQALLRNGGEADKLFGTTLTPDVLWELTPWSWAIDYFSNAGNVIQNVTDFAQQGLVMRYGYMMEEKSIKVTATMVERKTNFMSFDHTTVPPQTIEITSKVRRPANPFGFGLTLDDLSPLQVAILAAVGISLL